MNGFLITFEDGRHQIVGSTLRSDTGMLQSPLEESESSLGPAIRTIEPIQIHIQRSDDERAIVYGSARNGFSTQEIKEAIDRSHP